MNHLNEYVGPVVLTCFGIAGILFLIFIVMVWRILIPSDKPLRKHFDVDNIEDLADPTKITVEKAAGAKCPRCWHIHPATLNFGHTDEDAAAEPKLRDEHLCNRCVAIILKYHPGHESVPHILANLAGRGLKPEDNPQWETV